MYRKFFKRLFDFIFSFCCLIVLALPMLIIAIAVRCDSKGPAFFKTERVGINGKPFKFYKFRSMRTDAPKDCAPMLLDSDAYITKLGSFLRKSSLDELPQLVNVLKGDMTFVGHRPERRFYIERIIEQDPRYESLYQCRPGVTSIATLRNGYTDTMDKMLRRLRYDLFYLRHCSCLLDMKILAQTFFSIVGAKNF